MKELFRIPARVHGAGNVLFAWQKDGNYLATAGANGLVHVFDRNGDQVDEVPLGQTGACVALEWDKDGEMLAVLQAGNGKIALWDSTKRATTMIDTTMKDPSVIKWSKLGPQLAIGTAKGNLVLYNKDSRKITPIQGKHSKKITCGDWSASTNQLALGGMDNVMTVSDELGNTTDHAELKYEPVSLSFAAQKSDGKLRGGAAKPQTTVSINMGGNTLLLYNLKDPENPVELAFQARYGSIVKYQWFGDGYMMIGFSEGYVVVISTHMKEIVEELFSGKFHKDRIDDLALSEPMQRAATAGVNTIKIIDIKGWKEIKDETTQVDMSLGTVCGLQWTDDGQILTVATTSGTVLNYLAKMPTIVDACGQRVAYMSSLRELSVVDTTNAAPSLTLPISVEPSFVSLGPCNVAVGMNNQVWYYRADASGRQLVNEREYLSTVDTVKLTSQYAVVLSEGRVTIHPIESGGGPSGAGGGDRGSIVLPPRDDVRATCIATTEEFCVYGTSAGTIEFFYFGEWTLLAGVELRHEEAIRSVFPNAKGTRLVFIDASYRGFLFNPVNHLVLQIPKLSDNIKNVLWDAADWGVFAATDNKSISSYIHSPLTINGPLITQLGAMEIKDNGDMVMEAVSTDVPYSHTPVLLYDGLITCQTPSGSITSFVLRTHDAIMKSDRVTGDKIRTAFTQNVALLRLQAAWDVARVLNLRQYWLALSGKAMETLNIAMAIKVYRHLGDAGMVMALEQIQEVEDKNLLAGHIAMLFGDYVQAQELFLLSTRPVTALEMHRDLLHWDQAMKLAATLAPDQIAEIALEYGKQLEFKGEYTAALSLYQEAQRAATSNATTQPTVHAAIAGGLARMSLRTGDLRNGLTLANNSNDKQLQKECAAILEALKQYNDAGAMYIKAGQYDKAAGVFIHAKNFTAVTPLLDKITLPKLHAQYAKAKEAVKEYNEAAKAYERARDMDAVVRILLENLKQPDRASEVVRSTKSASGADLVAQYCLKSGDFRGAIEFLLIAKKIDDALQVAREHDEMELFAEALGTGAEQQYYEKIAKYYETHGKPGHAGKIYTQIGDYHKALTLFLECGEKMLDEAIRVVGLAKTDVLTHKLVDFLMGETDNVPKDPHYIFQLYMALGNYAQAGTTAIIIAKQEQEMGNYKVAHAILLQTYQELVNHKLRVPQDVQRMLSLLHSYVIVKKLVKRDDHLSAARMLVRVAKNISKFPSHIVPILTSTVIECQRAGLKKSAFEYAAMMMRPEYRQQIEPKFKQKIETLVRRPSKEELDEELSPCPFCDAPLALTTLDCPSCKNTLPYCIATGRHMVLSDWCQCPECSFPALYSVFTQALTLDNTCPMCEKEIDGSKVVRVEDARPLLRRGDEGEEGKPTS